MIHARYLICIAVAAAAYQALAGDGNPDAKPYDPVVVRVDVVYADPSVHGVCASIVRVANGIICTSLRLARSTLSSEMMN